MKTIGLLGGMSWESTELYYRYINQSVKDRLGSLHSARIAMVSVDFKEIEELQPATGAIILPRYQELKIHDLTLGNFTRNDLELKVRLTARQKEIAICDVS